MGQSYGYNRMEKLADYKTSEELILMLTDIVSRGGNLLLDIGPAADGTIPVIMEERLSDIGKWLDVNGEAIYGTTSWIQDKQWSEGEKPIIGGGNYQTNYDINQLVKPTDKQAYIQLFFTRKNTNLYCIIPSYSPKITINCVSVSKNSKVTVMGINKPVSWKTENDKLVVDLSELCMIAPPNKILVIKNKTIIKLNLLIKFIICEK